MGTYFKEDNAGFVVMARDPEEWEGVVCGGRQRLEDVCTSIRAEELIPH